LEVEGLACPVASVPPAPGAAAGAVGVGLPPVLGGLRVSWM